MAAPVDVFHEMREDPVLSKWLLAEEPTENFLVLGGKEMRSSTGLSARTELDGGIRITYDQLFIPLFRDMKFVLGYFFCPDLADFRAVVHSRSQSENFQRLPSGRFALDLEKCRMYTVSHEKSNNTSAGSALDFAPGYGLRRSSWFFGTPDGFNGKASVNMDCFRASGRFWDAHAATEPDHRSTSSDERSWRLRDWDSFRQLLSQVGKRVAHGQIETGLGMLNGDCRQLARSKSIVSHGDSCSPTSSILRWLFLGSINLLEVNPLAADAALRGRGSLLTTGDAGCSDRKGQAPKSSPDLFIAPPCEPSPEPRVQRTNKFLCSKCGASFARKSRLIDHERCVHLKVKQFSCPRCPLEFGLRHNLQRHVKMVHEKFRPKHCPVCGHGFHNSFVLARHMRAIHSKQRVTSDLKDES